MSNLQTIEQNYTTLSDVELQEVNGGGVVLLIGGGICLLDYQLGVRIMVISRHQEVDKKLVNSL